MDAEAQASAVDDGGGPHADAALLSAIAALRSINPNTVSVEQIRLTDERVGHLVNKAPLAQLEAVRGSLTVTENFPAFLVVLHASLAAAAPGDVRNGHLISLYVRLVMETPREWVATLPSRWTGAGRHAARLAVRSGDAKLALSLVIPLREAAAKQAPSDEHIVPLHADFLAVCLQAKSYDIGAEWVSHKRLQVEHEKTHLEASDVLLTYYYACCIYVGLKEFKKALHCARIALAVPAYASGKMPDAAVSAFKKFILLNVLVNGEEPEALNFSSYSASRLRNVASEYRELAAAYTLRKVSDVKDVVHLNKACFEHDSNFGLANQVVKSLPKQLIKDLSDSFVSIRIDDLATRAGLPDRVHAERVVLEMIADGSVRASIDAKQGVVRLGNIEGLENGLAFQEQSKSLLAMDERMERCLTAMKRIQVLRDIVVVDPVFAKKEAIHRRQENTSKKNNVSFDDGMEPMLGGRNRHPFESEAMF